MKKILLYMFIAAFYLLKAVLCRICLIFYQNMKMILIYKLLIIYYLRYQKLKILMQLLLHKLGLSFYSVLVLLNPIFVILHFCLCNKYFSTKNQHQ